MKIELIQVKKNGVAKTFLDILPGTTIAEALQHNAINLQSNEVCGIFGEVKSSEYVMQENDRLEIYLPLSQDPKHKRMTKVARSTLPRRCR